MWVLCDTKGWVNCSNSGTSLKLEISSNILPVDIILADFNDSFTSVVSWWGWANIFDIWNFSHVPLFDNDWTLWISVSALVVNILSCSIMVLELVEKHTSQVDIGVTSSLGTVWQNIFNNNWLEEFVSIWCISKVKSNIIRVLLSITWHGNNYGAWNWDWLCLDDNICISCWLYIIYYLSKLHLFVAHVWMI